MKRKIRKVAVLSVCLVILIIGIVACSFWRQYNELYISEEPIEFTPEAWDAGWEYRHRMVDSLMEQYNRLEGMTRSEVHALLGNNYGTSRPDTYLIGKKGMGAPPTMIEFYFDGGGIYIGYGFQQFW